MTAGLVLMCLSGLIIATHTYWIHEKITGTATSFCASDSIFSCDDVIGHETYGYAPVIGLPWGGLIGMGVFAALLYAAMMVQKEPDAPGRTRMLQMLMLLSGGGVPVILLLVSYELQIEKLCQYRPWLISRTCWCS